MERRRELARERQRRFRDRLRTESIRDMNRNFMVRRRQNMNATDREHELVEARNRAAERRARMTQEERDVYLNDLRNHYQERRANMSQEEIIEHNSYIRARNQERRLNTIQLNNEQFNIGLINDICRFCSAFRFQGELLNCCHNGKVRLPSLQECPLLLRRLLECDNHEARNYRDNIRNYNAAFSFASFGADVIMPPGRGPYCFRFQAHVTSYA
ncbi:hypothetical protein FHG87_011202 [Trinorchestia longiramus]|nr:hypothetical protein FHG87_011202 [Trinorchestia longiramus]